MAISKDALASLLKSHALAADEPPPPETTPPESDTTQAEDITGDELAAKLKEMLGCESNAECLATVTALVEATASASADTEEQKAEEVVDAAVRSGHVTPGQRDAALKIAKNDLASFKAFLSVPARVNVKRVAPAASAAVVALSKDELARCESLKINPEVMLATKKRLIEKGSK